MPFVVAAVRRPRRLLHRRHRRDEPRPVRPARGRAPSSSPATTPSTAGMRWGLFQMAEYINMITLSALARDALLRRLARLLGAARPALVPAQARSPSLFVFIWLRATLPRLRYDQLMRFGWKVLLPVATLNALVTAARGGRRLMSPQPPTRSRASASRSSRSSRSRSRSSTRSTSGRSTRASAAGTGSSGTRTGSRSASAARSAPPPARPTASASSPAENTPDNRVSAGERYARIYEINLSRCIFCGYCELACPFDAITLGNEFEISEYSRDDLIYTKDMLLARADQAASRSPTPTSTTRRSPTTRRTPDAGRIGRELPRLGRLGRSPRSRCLGSGDRGRHVPRTRSTRRSR